MARLDFLIVFRHYILVQAILAQAFLQAFDSLNLSPGAVDPEKEVRSEPIWAYPKRRFSLKGGSVPNSLKLMSLHPSSVSLKWHISTFSPLFEKQHLSSWLKLNIFKKKTKLHMSTLSDFQKFKFQTSKYHSPKFKQIVIIHRSFKLSSFNISICWTWKVSILTISVF